MDPLEAAIRAACQEIGASPHEWEGFAGIGRAALRGLLEALPHDPAEAMAALRSIVAGLT